VYHDRREGVRAAPGKPLAGGGNRLTRWPAGFDRTDYYDHAVARVRAALGEQAFETAWTEGRALTLEQAIAYALEEGSD